MQKALTQMNVKLQHVISNITGKTGMAIIEAIVSGERDPRQLAKLRDGRIRADEETIAGSLRGHWRDEHIFELTQALERYRFYHDQIGECDREIEAPMERFEDRSGGGSPANNGRWHSQGNAPRCDVRTHQYRMTGVDLTRIDGVDGFTALKVISEIGADLTKWPSAKRCASWLGLSPDHRITGGRVMSSKTKPNANRAAAALRLAANALHRSASARGAFLRRKKAQPGAPRAITVRPINWPDSSIPCCASGRSTWLPALNTTSASTSSARYAQLNAEPPNWAISWRLSPMLRTILRTRPSTHRQRPEKPS